MEVTKLTTDSIDELHNIYKEQFGNEAWTYQQIKDAFDNPAVAFYGIYENSLLVCFASILESVDDINLLDIATKQGYKNKGYATHMMKYLLSLKKDVQTFSLEVKSKNVTAIKLYEKFGLKTLHVRKKYYKDGDDALCMFLQENIHSASDM